MMIDFSTCTPEEAIAFFGEDGVDDFDMAVELLIECFTRAGRLAELEPYFEPVGT